MIKKILSPIWGILTSKPFKSFYWRASMAAIAWVIAELSSLGLPEFITLGIGLAMGEVSKQLNKGFQAYKSENNIK